MTELSSAVRIVAELRERLKQEYELEDGDRALEDTLEGASDLPEMLAKLARHAVWNERQAEAMGGIIRNNQYRKEAYDRRAERTRAAIAWAMQESGMKKIPADVLPDLGVSLSNGKPSLVIPDNEAVPHVFCRFKREPDKAAIREKLTESGPQSWAYFCNAKPTLTIRSK